MEQDGERINVEPMGVGLPSEVSSHEENKKKLMETLHRGGVLPNLRTYHGDIAKFIKSKDQSLTDVALKQQQKKEKLTPEPESKPRRRSQAPTNFLIYILSLVLAVGTIAVASYLYIARVSQDPIKIPREKTIVPAKKTVVIDVSTLNAGSVSATIESLVNSPEHNQGITAVEVSDSKERRVVAAADFAKYLDLTIPSSLARTLGDEYMLGLYGETSDLFLILKVKDYGIAFRDMLEWESALPDDFLSLISTERSTSTQTAFRDLIVRNKDTRAAISESGRVSLLYTFLDKQTVLITQSEESLIGVLDAYIAGRTVR